MTTNLNIPVISFADNFMSNDSELKIIKRNEVIYEGTVEDLYNCGNIEALYSTVDSIESVNGIINLKCK